MKDHGLSLGLAPFFSHEPTKGIHTDHPVPHAPSSGHPLHNALDDLDISSPSPMTNNALLTLHHFQNSPCATPPISPPNAYSALYPLPPHLTPLPSPNTSRATSPEPDHDQVLHSTKLLGKITVTVVEARGLAVSSLLEKPYVLLQFDRTDSVSREYGAGPIEPTKANGVIKKEGGLNGLQSLVTVRRTGGEAVTKKGVSAGRDCNESERVVTDHAPIGDQKDIGTPDAPIWNHVAEFDVIQTGRTILICIYDKLAPQGGWPVHGFLGATVFEPSLSPEPGEDGMGADIWLPLQSALDPSVGGEVRVRVLFEKHAVRAKLCVDDFSVLHEIGRGSFGRVYRVRKRDTKRIYAMKVISKQSVKSSTALAQLLAERQVLARTLDSPFLVGLKFSFQNPTTLFFVIDYKSGGELFSHLQREVRFEEKKVRFYLAEIILGLEYLHSKGIIYRDLKPENCLLDQLGHVCLVDFGLSKLLDSCEESTRTLCGTGEFMAPEVLLDIGYNYRCDWWSTGVLFFEMCFGRGPFYAESRVDEYELILSGEIKIPNKKEYSPESRDLLLKFLTRDPDLRIGSHGGASEIQSHPFFASIDWLKCGRRQISPPYKPPVAADLDQCDLHDMGRGIGDWMFSEEGCWQTPSARGSKRDSYSEADLDDKEGQFRDFAFSSGEDNVCRPFELVGRRSSWEKDAP